MKFAKGAAGPPAKHTNKKPIENYGDVRAAGCEM